MCSPFPVQANRVVALLSKMCSLAELWEMRPRGSNLRWEYVDLERAVLRLPDSRTGKKIIPLGATAVQLLAAAPRLESRARLRRSRSPPWGLTAVALALSS